jgi:hypothetical protein
MGFEPGAGAAALSGSIHAKILHYILTYPFGKKVDHLVAKAFLDLFMLDEETFMSNPIKLEQKMRDHFGNKRVQPSFHSFMTWFRRGSDLLTNSAAHNEEEEAEALPEWCCALAEAVLELVYELLSSERWLSQQA